MINLNLGGISLTSALQNLRKYLSLLQTISTLNLLKSQSYHQKSISKINQCLKRLEIQKSFISKCSSKQQFIPNIFLILKVLIIINYLGIINLSKKGNLQKSLKWIQQNNGIKSSQQGLDIPLYKSKSILEPKTFDNRGFTKNKEKLKKAKIGRILNHFLNF